MRPVPVVFLRFALMLQLTKRKCYNDFRAIEDGKLAPYLLMVAKEISFQNSLTVP